MDFFDFFYNKILVQLNNYIANNNLELKNSTTYTKFNVELPKNKVHGDIATNIAMLIAKQFNSTPKEFFNNFLPYLQKITEFNTISFVEPGFINITINNNFWHQLLLLALQNKDISFPKNNINVNVEFVSANPTGPLHIGNARGAVLGDVLSNLYKFCGYNVTKEYYINDAGNQINNLAKSVYIKYLELQNINNVLGEAQYPGEYIIDIAKQAINIFNTTLINATQEEWLDKLKVLSVNYILNLIQTSLQNLAVNHDVFSSELAIATKDNYNNLINILTKDNLVYMGKLTPPKGMVVEGFEAREQKLFKSTLFGDDIDRPLEKSNGELTYFAGDAVYHKNKIDRGFNKLIVILGSDHIGYGTRISAFVQAYTKSQVTFNVVYTQMVNLLLNGKPARMSKREGNFILLQDVVDKVGKDIVRFIMITRKSDVMLDFDFNKLTTDNMDNPLFYINYAYARIVSVFKHFKEAFPNINLEDNLSTSVLNYLNSKQELEIIKLIAKFNKVIKATLHSNDLYKLYLYLLELSECLHAFWNCGKQNEEMRFIIKNNQNLTIARVLLLKALASKIKIIMQIANINIKEQM